MEPILVWSKQNSGNEDALKIKYIRIIRWFQSTICAWPKDEVGQKLHWSLKCLRLFLPFQCSFLWFGQVHYIVNNNLNFLEFGDALLTCMMTTLEWVRLTISLFKGYREVIRDFIMSFHLIHFKHRGIHFDKIYKTVEKVSYYWTVYMVTLTFSAGILFNVATQYKNYKNGTFSHVQHTRNITRYEFAIYFSFPFLNPFDHFVAVTMINVFYTYCCDVAVTLMDLLVMVMTFHIIGHVTILRKNLESIAGPERTENLQFVRRKIISTARHERYSKEENERISVILKDCVNHHRFIVRFTDKMSHFLSAMIAVTYTFHLVACCILLLECVYGGISALVRFGPATLVIFGQLMQLSIIFEIVGTVSEKLPDALYSIPWECMDLSNQRSLCILLQRLQRPIHITAMGMTTVGVTTMAQILKTTFSYFAFLKSIGIN